MFLILIKFFIHAATTQSGIPEAVEKLLALYNATVSSTTAPNCCTSPIQSDIALLLQLASTYQVNFGANSESITFNFVQNLNSNIEILRANWTLW